LMAHPDLWIFVKVLFALFTLQTNTTSCMMIMPVRKCPNVNLHTTVFPLKHRPMHTSRALGGIIASKNFFVRRAIVPKVIAIILGQVILPISIRWTARQTSPNLALGNWIRYPISSREPPLIPEYYAACHFSETMPNVVDTDPIQRMFSHAATMSSKKKAQKLTAYEADPITVDDCLRSKNWETPKAGNSWKDAILNEIGNLMKFKVFDVISWQDVPTGERVWQVVVNFLTKRTKDSTPERECIDNANAVFVLGGII
jgi:hypothetical protein